jgi:hypothetical protein
MIKRIFLIAFGCFICGVLKAQHQQIFDEYRMEAGDQAEMFVGKLEIGYSSTVYMNSPYLFSDDFVVGDVMYNGLLYQDVPIRYDGYLKQLVVNTPVRHLNICVSMHLVDKFTLDGIDYERRDGDFVALLFDSSHMELIEQVSVIVNEEFISSVSLKYRFDKIVKYFVLSEGRKYEVSKLRSVQKIYPNIKKELKRFSKQNRLDFKEHRKSSLASLMKYADELLTTPLK